MIIYGKTSRISTYSICKFLAVRTKNQTSYTILGISLGNTVRNNLVLFVFALNNRPKRSAIPIMFRYAYICNSFAVRTKSLS